MAQKCALIVDDSRTARQVLGRVLENNAMRVEAAESAEAALEFLTHSRPDVIFMDHMMPGMDGFQAVRAIKANPATATIPIMMYTSQEGELYVGQARALGAVGVLPKQIKPVEVSQMLESLHLIGPDEPQQVAAPVETSAPPVPQAQPRQDPVVGMTEPGDWTEMHSWLEEMLAHHGRDLRDDIEATVARLLEERTEHAAPVPAEPPRRPTATNLLVLALAGLAGIFLWLHLDTQAKWRATAARNASLLEALDARRSSAAAETSGIVDRLDAERRMLSSRYAEFLAALEWSVNQSAVYGPQEIPMSDARLAILDGLVSRLQGVGFTGVVQLASHVGNFCYLTGPDGSLVPAAGDFPAEACDQIGLVAEDARQFSAKQSVAFANYVAALSTDDSIRIEVDARGSDDPRFAYPPLTQGTTAAEWNRVARRNHRVEIRLLPEADAS